MSTESLKLLTGLLASVEAPLNRTLWGTHHSAPQCVHLRGIKRKALTRVSLQNLKGQVVGSVSMASMREERLWRSGPLWRWDPSTGAGWSPSPCRESRKPHRSGEASVFLMWTWLCPGEVTLMRDFEIGKVCKSTWLCNDKPWEIKEGEIGEFLTGYNNPSWLFHKEKQGVGHLGIRMNALYLICSYEN